MNVLTQRPLIRIVLGVLIGAALGFLYYRFIGCSTGACPITRNPVSSMIYGALMGFLIASA
jgi:hypothetical protein